MTATREAQLEYSLVQPLMSDVAGRRRKAAKIVAVVEHFLGRSLDGLLVVDAGCSVGIIAGTIAEHGARVVGVDIDRPGLAAARTRVDGTAALVCADGAQLPFADASVDVVVFNHVYEHLVDPEGAVAELRRVVKPNGVLFLGLGNRLGVMEPHHRLPFLSWLPAPLADHYLQRARGVERYHERFATRRGLQRMFAGMTVWDYTLAIAQEPERFAAGDVVPSRVASMPAGVLRLGRGLFPSYVWLATAGSSAPLGPSLRTPPERVPTS
jgi:SAM-dependent methyltransferase